MKTEFQESEEISIATFADRHGLVMEVTERDHLPKGDHSRYYANFKAVEENGDGVLIGLFGDGRTPDEAIASYANIISLKRLVVDAFEKSRREIKAPRLFYSLPSESAP